MIYRTPEGGQFKNGINWMFVKSYAGNDYGLAIRLHKILVRFGSFPCCGYLFSFEIKWLGK